MITRRALLAVSLLVLAACGGDNLPIQPFIASQIAVNGGDRQSAQPGSPLPEPLSVRVTDAAGDPVSNVGVTWSVVDGGGTASPTASTTGSDGVGSSELTLGPTEGDQHAQAAASGLAGSPVVFTATATPTPPPPVQVTLKVRGGGDNVPERYTSDLWVYGDHAYTGTWGGLGRDGDHFGDVLKIWSLDASGAPTLADSVKIDEIGTVSDVQVSDDGQVLMFSTELGFNAGLYLYSLANPTRPTPLDHVLVESGVHTASIGEINGRRYAFAARNPGDVAPALLIYDITDPAHMSLTATVKVPPNYGIHDTYVRDGLVFVFAWNTGVIIYDIGNGVRGGSPAAPAEVGRLVTSTRGVCCGPSVHNGWWFHNPVTHENRYLFIGQEGAGVIGSQSSGDIHVVDVSDLTSPHEVAFFHLNGAGTHNFWMDEGKQVLYAAYYNKGVVALDVSGTLSGDLSGRLLSQIRPGGNDNTFTWGVQLANGYLYASDMLSGLWQLGTE